MNAFEVGVVQGMEKVADVKGAIKSGLKKIDSAMGNTPWDILVPKKYWPQSAKIWHKTPVYRIGHRIFGGK
jgi:hypothetical protein